jgi:alpha-tubulin suppressor-like RCC1 family protein
MKKTIVSIISVLLCVVMVTAGLFGVNAVDPQAGDINKDGDVNNKDVVALFRHLSGVSGDVDEIACDTNGDGALDNKDVVALFRYVSDPEHVVIYYGKQEGTVTETGEITEPEETTEPEVHEATPYDLIFRQVYGTGKNNDTAVRYSFIELYNTSEYPLELDGLAVYSYDADTKAYVSRALPDEAVPSNTSYLIRCAEAAGKNGEAYDSTNEKMLLEHYDHVWNITLNNKEIQLVLADKGKNYGNISAADISGAYTYFIASSTDIDDINAVKGISKNKSAYRSAPGEAYIIVDYKNASVEEIEDYAPGCLAGRLNGPVPVEEAAAVKFSHGAGVYGSEFDLTLTTKDGYQIYYTRNGSDPRSGGTLYTGPIRMANSDSLPWGDLTRLCNTLNGASNPRSSRQIGARGIRAYATNGTDSTQVETNTYFVSKKLLGYDTMFMAMTIQPEDFLSSDKGIYHTQMADPFGTKQRRVTYLEIFESTGERVSASYTEMALNGNGSLGFNCKSMRFYFKSDANPDYVGNPSKLKYDIFQGQARDGVTEYKRILLRNSGNDTSHSHLRDAYMQKLCSTLNVPTMAYRPVLLFINGELWGVYNARERYDTKYFESHFGIKEEDFVMLESPSPLTTGGNGNVPYVVNDGEEGDEIPFHELVSYIETHDLSNDQYFAYVEERLDTDNMIDFFVGSMYLANIDWPWNNIKVWRNKNPEDTQHDTKWRFVFCDMDMGVGLETNIDTNMFTYAIQEGTVAGRMMNRMLQNATFKNRFIDRFYECAETIFDPSVAIPMLEEMYENIKDIMPLHYNRWPGDGGSASVFESHINSIRYFMNNRKAKALAHMEDFFHIQPKSLTVTFDEEAASVSVDGSGVSSGYARKITGSGNVSVSVSLKSGYELIGIKRTDANGTVRTLNDTDFTLSVNTTCNITVLTQKTGKMYSPSVVTGSRAVFAVDSDGVLFAWGANEYGQLGIISNTLSKPVPVFSDVVKVATSMGGTESDAPMTAVLTASGDVYTTGNNSGGQLGRGGNTFSFAKVDLGFKAKDISCGFDHFIVLAENGDLYGIGNNSYGQLGANNFGKTVSTFQRFLINVKTAVAGRRHTMYITQSGALYVLGDNRWNKFSAAADEKLTTPLKLGDGFKFVSTGQHNCLAIDNDSNLYYAGWRSTTSFVAGESSGGLTKIATGMKEAYIQDEHIIMLSTDGKVYGYGLNNYQQISTDAQTKSSPFYIMDGCIGCGAGTHYSAAIKSDGWLVLWGYNTCGTIGNGSISASYVAPYNAIDLK